MSEPNEVPLLGDISIKESIDQATVNTVIEPKHSQAESVSYVAHQEIVEHHQPEVVESAVEQEPLITKRRPLRRFTIIQVISLVCTLIGLVLIFAMPPLIQSIIVQQAKDQVIMTSANEGLWGHFPGDSDTIIVRNFTFFHLNNEQEFLLFGQKPSFKEISGFKIQELEDFLDVNYLEDGNLVQVRDWTRFEDWPESRNLDEKVNILNMGNLGYWSTLKKARPTLLLQQGLATLFTNMQQSIIPTIIGQGISQQFITNISTAYYTLLAPAGVDAVNVQFLWQDPVYGLSDKQNVGIWAMAAANCYKDGNFSFSNESIILKNYFTLSDRQTEYLMRKINGYVRNLNQLLIQNHYCYKIEKKDCTGRYLSVAQLAESFVTHNTPPVSSIEQTYSICDDNVTCKGSYPELYAFYKKVYQPKMMKKGDDDLTFSQDTVLKWFQYDRSYQVGKDYNTAENCLLHIGNLDKLWEWGTAYDQDGDWHNMQNIMVRFELQSLDHAHVFWEWLKYLSKDFVLQNTNNAKLGISTLFTKAFYEQFVYLQDHLQHLLLTELIKQQLQGQECHMFFQKSLDQQEGSQLVINICHQYGDIHSQEFANKMYNVCEKKFGKDWHELADLSGLVGIENHCDPQGPQGGIGQIIHSSKMLISNMYGCGSNTNPYCSNFKLALLQWQKSVVTLNVPEPLSKLFTPSTTFSSWDSNFTQFEYWHFQQKFPTADQDKFPVFTTQTLVKKFTFEQWFSSSVILRQLAEGKVNHYLMKYVRYICVTIAMKGYTTNRTPRQILFGYEDEFLKKVKQDYAPFGGDPSAPSVIAFNELNVSEADASQIFVFKTGKDDYTQVYQSYQINGYRYLVNNVSWFDGNNTRWQMRSPWAENDYFYGTTAKIFAPDQFDANNLSLLIPQVQRYGSNHFHGESFQVERFGIDLYISYLNHKIGEVSPQNDKYYQTLQNVFNVSSIYGLPLYVTKNHFMNCTDWLGKVDIFDENMSTHYQEISHWDDTFIIVEPYTGVSFQSVIYLQNNYFHQPDQLYDYPIDTFLPIFSISRSGNLTEQKFHHYYDPLVSAFTMKSAILYIGIGLTVVSVLILGFITFKKRKFVNAQPELKNSQAGISMQNMQHLSEEKQDILAEQKEREE